MSKKQKPKSSFAIICLSLIILILTVTLPILFFLTQGSSEGRAKGIVIPRGASLNKVVSTLERESVIANAFFFKLLLRTTGGNQKVRAGEYEFKENMRPLEALEVLYYAQPLLHQVTIPEGWTVRQVAKILSAKNLANEQRFVSLALNKKTAMKYRLTSPTLEGYLFPDTYSFSRSETEEKIIQAMVNRFFEMFKPYEKEMRRKGFSLNKLVTLASIVEKETGHAPERPMIASVFLNRLRKGMRLESDPTTIYGIANFNGNLTKRDLQTRTPYNTYKIRGLPPGPIANPGVDAMVAVLRPAKSDFLFFVSNNNGSHTFSKTYDEHRHYVNVLQRGWGRKRNRNRSRRN